MGGAAAWGSAVIAAGCLFIPGWALPSAPMSIRSDDHATPSLPRSAHPLSRCTWDREPANVAASESSRIVRKYSAAGRMVLCQLAT